MNKLLGVVILVLLCSCNSDDDTNNKECGDAIIINEQLFLQDSPGNFVILNAQIIENCISIEIGASGCDANSWGTILVTDGMETASIPPARLLSFKLTNLEDCLAYFTRVYSFDLGIDEQTVIYSLEGWPDELIYNY